MVENEGETNNIDNSDSSKFKIMKGKYHYLERMCSGSEVLDPFSLRTIIVYRERKEKQAPIKV